MQMHAGNYFLMEDPAYADSWKIPEVVEFLNVGGVDHVVADQCMYGLKTRISRWRGTPGQEAHQVCQQQLVRASGVLDEM